MTDPQRYPFNLILCNNDADIFLIFSTALIDNLIGKQSCDFKSSKPSKTRSTQVKLKSRLEWP